MNANADSDADRMPHRPSILRPPLILASGSPRRRSLLEAAGYPIEIEVSDVPEHDPEPWETPEGYVTLLAWRKATAVASRRRRGLVLGADTTCAIDGVFLNKPIDRDDAERMIRLQEGRLVPVWTGIALVRAESGEGLVAVERSVCRFRELGDAERTAYLDSGKWEGKAGAYGIQDDDPVVEMVEGAWSNIVGLPMELLDRLLREYPRLWN